jgi:iron-sulfur cluster repair protein YtfE (RIC family)
MARLIEELKREHAEIARLLDTVKSPKISNAEAHKILLSAKNTLISHLRKEDTQLYPLLNKAAESNTSLKRTVDFYARDMDEITAKAIAFFDKYSKDDAPIDLEFAKAFGNLFATISRRLRSEESTLYLEYEKLSKI